MCLSPKSVKYLVRNGSNILAQASCESIHIFGKMVFVLSGAALFSGFYSVGDVICIWGLSYPVVLWSCHLWLLVKMVNN